MNGQGSNNHRTHHSRQCSHTIGNAHQDAGIARSNVQMIDIKACQHSMGLCRDNDKSENYELCLLEFSAESYTLLTKHSG